MPHKFVYTVLILFLSPLLYAQEAHPEHEMKGAHRISSGMGHTHVANGLDKDGKKIWLLEPSWSFNYDFWLSNKWAIGLQTDVVLEKFVVEDVHGKDVEREMPVALIPAAIFKPFRHFSFIGGAGVELEKHENMVLTRLGAEYGVGLPKAWEAGIALMWDDKWGHYNSWIFEFTFSKVFLKRKTKHEAGNGSLQH